MRLLPAIAVATFLGLGACAATPSTVITHQDLDQEFYRGNGYNAAVRDGLAPVTVVGEPFPGVGAAAALAPLTPPASVAARGFAPADDAGARVVLIFHPRGPLSRADACAPAADLRAHVGAPGTEGGFTALVSLCQGSRRVSTALVHAAAPQSVSDPAYAGIMAQVLTEILPLTVPRELPQMP
ncbi:hypothetical protein [Zavarzinia aquatilis]|uniref:DUF4136 domain-containing protein n=1 Tax=Zavarzinia aquatilis TaxID=2211142 RepID=A0A317EFJ1_9PROT|nr:hypothetical protein [Zavarzinia aquatilis]PWR25808.1 hypothetical protein DKG74_02300 [Zavarzinia aquatilis]